MLRRNRANMFCGFFFPPKLIKRMGEQIICVNEQGDFSESHPFGSVFFFSPHRKNSGGPLHCGVVLNKIQGADSQSQDQTHRDGEREGKLPGFPLPLARERGFPSLPKRKAPRTVLPSAAAAARRGGAPSAAAPRPLPATNGAASPVSGKLFPCQARARGAPGSGFPRASPVRAPAWGEAESPQKTTFWFPF